MAGKILVLPPPYTAPDPTPFLQIANIHAGDLQQGLFDLELDPNFASNHYFYVFYTAAIPSADRLSRFTATSTLTGTVPGSELVLYQDPQVANNEHHGGAIAFGNDGMIYFTTGEHFQGTPSQDLNSPRGKIHRISTDGLVPTDNPFYDGAGPHWDSVWAYGLRNPFRAYFDRPTGRLFIGDVGGNGGDSNEEVDLGARGANYGWPDVEGPCSAPCTEPLYSYIHNAGDGSCVTGGFVYHGTQFPTGMRGELLLRRLLRTLDQAAWRSTPTAMSAASPTSSRSPASDAGRRHRLPHRRAGRRAVLPRPRLRRHDRHFRGQQAPPHPLPAVQPGPGGARVGEHDIGSRAA